MILESFNIFVSDVLNRLAFFITILLIVWEYDGNVNRNRNRNKGRKVCVLYLNTCFISPVFTLLLLPLYVSGFIPSCRNGAWV